MNKKHKIIFTSLLFLFLFSFFIIPAVLAVECKTGFEPQAGVCFPIKSVIGLSDASVNDIIKNLMNWILGIFGLLAIIAFVVSGIQYLTSAGEEKSVETAKRNMKWAAVGVIVALSGYVIIKAVDAALKATSATF